MKCEKCKGDGRQIGGKLHDGSTAVGWGICDLCGGTGKRMMTVVEPPDLQTVIAQGYTPEEAAVIVKQEQDKAGRGERPYGPNEPTSPWGTPTKTVSTEPERSFLGKLNDTFFGNTPLAPKFTPGQKVALTGGGPVMTVTADLGDEVACEWPILNEDGKEAGRQSRAFAVSSLKPVE